MNEIYQLKPIPIFKYKYAIKPSKKNKPNHISIDLFNGRILTRKKGYTKIKTNKQKNLPPITLKIIRKSQCQTI